LSSMQEAPCRRPRQGCVPAAPPPGSPGARAASPPPPARLAPQQTQLLACAPSRGQQALSPQHHRMCMHGDSVTESFARCNMVQPSSLGHPRVLAPPATCIDRRRARMRPRRPGSAARAGAARLCSRRPQSAAAGAARPWRPPCARSASRSAPPAPAPRPAAALAQRRRSACAHSPCVGSASMMRALF